MGRSEGQSAPGGDMSHLTSAFDLIFDDREGRTKVPHAALLPRQAGPVLREPECENSHVIHRATS